MEKVSRALVMALLEILYYLGLIIVYHLILTKKKFLKKDFLIVGEGDTFVINGSFGAPEKNLILFLLKQRKKHCLSLHYNSDKTYLFVNGKKIYKFKPSHKNVSFPSQFFLGSISDKFDCVNSEEVSFKGNVYDFSVDYGSIEKSEVLNIHKYLMSKNNMK